MWVLSFGNHASYKSLVKSLVFDSWLETFVSLVISKTPYSHFLLTVFSHCLLKVLCCLLNVFYCLLNGKRSRAGQQSPSSDLEFSFKDFQHWVLGFLPECQSDLGLNKPLLCNKNYYYLEYILYFLK